MESTLVTNPPPPVETDRKLVTRRNFLRLAAGSAAGMALYAGEISRHELDTVHQTIHLAGLPDSFAGFRIAQISDFHFEEYTEPLFLKEIVHRVNEAKPDLVVLTGDFVSSGPLPHHDSIGMGHRCAELLKRLDCPVRYAILGNHDALVGAQAITEALEGNQIPVLADTYVPLEREGRRIWLAGMKDVLEQRPSLTAALPKARDPRHEPLILLSHEPDFADYALGHDIALTLSGHTHGGQIRIPFVRPLILPDLVRRYVDGLFRLPDGMQLYVNRGIGAVGLPFRFRCPAEITLLSLQPAV
jgi:predicted MPP superfamily phosphohydrolase